MRFYTECLGVEQDEGKVTAKLRDRGSHSSNENTYTVTGNYLIAADGANSPIRSQLGVSTTGCGAMGHLLNILFHADLESLVKRREFNLCLIDRPEVSGLLNSINNSNRWVFHLYYDPSKGESPEDFPPERCKELLRIALGLPDIEIEVKSILPWEPSVRVATKLQHGRIFLAGDAAHQMPPWGGQGANTGISDVHNLAWKLGAVIKRQADPELLQTYDIERQPVGKMAAEVAAAAADNRGLIYANRKWKLAIWMTQAIPLVGGFGYSYPHESIAVVEENTWPLGGVTWKAWSTSSLFLSLDGRPGTRAPHVWIEKEGKRISTIDLFGKGFVLLAGSEGGAWVNASQTVRKKLAEVELTSYCIETKGSGIIDKERKWETAAGISPSGALLVRPDGFVAWRQRRLPVDTDGELDKTFRRILCLG